MLYINQDYPDNYVDKSFLAEMKKNQNVQPLNLVQVINASSRVSQQFSVIILFVETYQTMGENIIPEVLITIMASIYLVFMVKNSTYLMNGILFTLVLVFITPILRNLTRDISTDSINSLSFLMFILNLLFHDYNADSKARAQ